MRLHHFLIPVVVLLGSIDFALAADPGSTHVVAHRGLLLHAPENTLSNFRACLELRVGIEVDVRRSRDGQLVCLHDESVERTTNAKGNVSDLSLAQLKALDAGTWFDPAFRQERVPTIDEVFEVLSRYPPGVLVAMDVKVANVEADLVRLANQRKILDRLIFIGLTITMPEVRQRLKGADPKASVAILANERPELAAAIQDRVADWVYVRFVPNNEEVARVHQAGKRIFIAGPTVAGEEVENWRRAAANGVDGVLTDHPLSFRQALRNKTAAK